MKTALKIIGIVAGVLIAAKLLQLLIDYAYETYGKHYITTDTVE